MRKPIFGLLVGLTALAIVAAGKAQSSRRADTRNGVSGHPGTIGGPSGPETGAEPQTPRSGQATVPSRLKSWSLFGLAVLVAALGAALIVMLTEIPFTQGAAIIDEAPAATSVKELIQPAVDMRLALSQHYFEWAVLTIGICGGCALSRPVIDARFMIRPTIVIAFILSSTSIVMGSTHLELTAQSISHGIPALNMESFLDLYPVAQFYLVTLSFILAIYAASVSIIFPRSTEAGDERP